MAFGRFDRLQVGDLGEINDNSARRGAIGHRIDA
jgi:hypothetical protein